MMCKAILLSVSVALSAAIFQGSTAAQVVWPAVPRAPWRTSEMGSGDAVGVPLPDGAFLGPLEAGPPEVRFQLLTHSLDFGSLLPGAAPSAVVDATVEGWDAIRVGVQLPPGQEQLALSRRDASGAEATIATTWRLRWNSGANWSPWLKPSIGAAVDSLDRALWWEVGDPGCCAYQLQLRCDLAPLELQPRGGYAGRIRFVAVPAPGLPAQHTGDQRAGTRALAPAETPAGDAYEDGRWMTRRRGVIRVPHGTTTHWGRRSGGVVREWMRR